MFRSSAIPLKPTRRPNIISLTFSMLSSLTDLRTSRPLGNAFFHSNTWIRDKVDFLNYFCNVFNSFTAVIPLEKTTFHENSLLSAELIENKGATTLKPRFLKITVKKEQTKYWCPRAFWFHWAISLPKSKIKNHTLILLLFNFSKIKQCNC